MADQPPPLRRPDFPDSSSISQAPAQHGPTCPSAPTPTPAGHQGTGNFVNGCVILLFMVFFAQTSAKLDPTASRNIIMIQVSPGVGRGRRAGARGWGRSLTRQTGAQGHNLCLNLGRSDFQQEV
jgi:hypothetical protein